MSFILWPFFKIVFTEIQHTSLNHRNRITKLPITFLKHIYHTWESLQNEQQIAIFLIKILRRRTHQLHDHADDVAMRTELTSALMPSTIFESVRALGMRKMADFI